MSKQLSVTACPDLPARRFALAGGSGHKLRVKYGWKWERMSEKINWFLSRSLKERYELALSLPDVRTVCKKRVAKSIDGVRINYLSLSDLIKSKSATKRLIDREDIKALYQIAKTGK